jgi:uncharacterized protein (TIGR02270 family)
MPVSKTSAPVIDSILEQHAEEVAFLWSQRDRATDAPHYPRRYLARLDERVEAHLDGLRVAGPSGREIVGTQYEAHPGAGEAFAVAALALEAGDTFTIDLLVANAAASEEARDGLSGAIGWCAPRSLAGFVRRWQTGSTSVERWLFLVACSHHRGDPGVNLLSLLSDADEAVRARALRLAGEVGRTDVGDAVAESIGDPVASPAFWAAWSAMLLGQRNHAAAELQAVALSASLFRMPALETVLRGDDMKRSIEWVRMINSSPGQEREVMTALGHIGDPASVPWLLSRMADIGLARGAGESFCMITGVDLVEAGLDRLRPDDLPEVPSDDPADEHVEMDPDDGLPWPEPTAVEQWWRANHERFQTGQRHLLGRLVSTEAAEQAWAHGVQRQRRAAAYELALRAPTVRLLNWRAAHRGAA